MLKADTCFPKDICCGKQKKLLYLFQSESNLSILWYPCSLFVNVCLANNNYHCQNKKMFHQSNYS